MVQREANESSDFKTGAMTVEASLSDKLSSEITLDDRRQFFDKQRPSYQDSGNGNSAAAVLGGLELVDSGSKSTIYVSEKSGAPQLGAGKGGQLSAADHLSRSGWQDSGDAGKMLGSNDSSRKFSYEEIMMSSQSGDVVSKDPKPGDGRAEARRRAYESLQREAGASGDSAENREKAAAIGKKLLDGKDVTKELSELPPQQRRAVVQELKRQLAEMPGTVVDVKTMPGQPGDPSTASRYTKFQTKNGTIVAIEEAAIGGEPRQIQVNGTGLSYKLSGAREVYNANPSRAEGTPGFNPIMRLREWAVPFTEEEMQRANERRQRSGDK